MTRADRSPSPVAGGYRHIRAVSEVLQRHVSWLCSYGFASYDPHDFWASAIGRAAKLAYYRNQLIGALAAGPFVALDVLLPISRQLVARPLRYPIADAHFAMAFYLLHRASPSAELFGLAAACLDSLRGSRVPARADFAWGLPFDWQSRGGLFSAGTPLITMTPYVYEAFEASFEQTADSSLLDVMESIGHFAYHAIPETEIDASRAAAAYSPVDRRQVVNASAYRGFLLVSAGLRFHHEEWFKAGMRNVEFVRTVQRADGLWPYSLDASDGFVDNVHTCFVLKNLIKVHHRRPTPELRSTIELGLDGYRSLLLDANGLPITHADHRRRPVRRELYDYAEAINLGLLARQELGVDTVEMVDAIVSELLRSWVLSDGHFASRKMVVGWNLVPYHRWGQSQVFRSLALYTQAA